MKKIIYVILFSLVILTLQACQLAKTEKSSSKNANPNYIGIRIRYDKDILGNDKEKTMDMDYYYFDESVVSPFISKSSKEDYISQDGTHVRKTEVYVHINRTEDFCFQIEIIKKNEDNQLSYEATQPSCGMTASYTIRTEYQDEENKDLYEFTVHLIEVQSLIKYTFTMLDDNYNKISYEVSSLEKQENTILLENQTKYFKIEEDYGPSSWFWVKPYESRNLYSINDMINHSFTDTIYILKDGNRTYYHFIYQLDKK